MDYDQICLIRFENCKYFDVSDFTLFKKTSSESFLLLCCCQFMRRKIVNVALNIAVNGNKANNWKNIKSFICKVRLSV